MCLCMSTTPDAGALLNLLCRLYVLQEEGFFSSFNKKK